MAAAMISGFGIRADASGIYPVAEFSIEMDAAQEPDGASFSPGTARGSATLFEQAVARSLSFEILFDATFDFTLHGGGGDGGSETVLALHIHNQRRGVNGDVVFGMISPNSDLDSDLRIEPADGGTRVSGEWDYPGEGVVPLYEFLPALGAANPGEDVDLYVNLHTSAFEGGAIRGQLVAVPELESALLVGVGLLVLACRRRSR